MKTRTLLTLAVLAAIAASTPSTAKDNNLCTQTSKAGRSACETEVRNAFFIAVGICTNASDGSARTACKQAAKQTLRETGKDCGSVFHARETLCDTIGQGAYDPDLSPSHFVSPAAAAANPNPFLRLVPGSIRTYDGPSEHVVVTVTDQQKVIGGVACTVVRDIVTAGGQLIEDTEDYFAQHTDGSVWYFGELSKAYDNGELASLHGSFKSGTAGAKAGIAIKAAAAVGDTYRQEFAFGDAEDVGAIMSLTGSATVPAASCTNTCLITADTSPLEPDHVEHKYFAPGIGEILTVDVDTGERLELVGFTNP
jgi:hypothetical protein